MSLDLGVKTALSVSGVSVVHMGLVHGPPQVPDKTVVTFVCQMGSHLRCLDEDPWLIKKLCVVWFCVCGAFVYLQDATSSFVLLATSTADIHLPP